ncbi:MAG: lipoyl(octanoyl) transferase LipB [Thiohalorhabdus sp.]|uniref:lipoyl(octanoyl) transferase LipB n=1 Tax=Thiohalorhabdus sp. TaxID=3094134 RepID=UPI00397F6EDD
MPTSSPIPTSSPPSEDGAEPRVRDLGRREYETVWAAMRAFTAERTAGTPDELWLVEHPPVFTQGRNGRPEHLLNITGIPVVETDRGGQVTYHGPGQAVAYPLLDLRRRGWGVRHYVAALEQAVIDLLAGYGLAGVRKEGAPGVYLDRPGLPKVAAIGLRVRGGCTYHGVSLNLTNDLEPFTMINPCGYAGMAVTRLADHVPGLDAGAARGAFTSALLHQFHPSQESVHGR